jgi:hypothetical protein
MPGLRGPVGSVGARSAAGVAGSGRVGVVVPAAADTVRRLRGHARVLAGQRPVPACGRGRGDRCGSGVRGGRLGASADRRSVGPGPRRRCGAVAVDVVQRSAAGEGVGKVQVHRVDREEPRAASDAASAPSSAGWSVSAMEQPGSWTCIAGASGPGTGDRFSRAARRMRRAWGPIGRERSVSCFLARSHEPLVGGRSWLDHRSLSTSGMRRRMCPWGS